MTGATGKSKSKADVLGTGPGATLPFDSIHEPGAYVCRWSGHLLRIGEDGIGPERAPRMDVVGHEPLLVTKIDDDPYISVTTARIRAANHDVAVNF